MTVQLAPLISILFGVLILVFPKALNYLVAVYLILTGLVGLGFLVVR
jgi:hypothetical protein